jgi:hypothetical protein
MENPLLILQFITVFIFGSTCMVLFAKRKLNLNLAYPAFFIGSIMALVVYKQIPGISYGNYPLTGLDLLYATTYIIVLVLGLRITANILKLKKPNLGKHTLLQNIAMVSFYIAASFMQEFLYRPFIYDFIKYFLKSPDMVFIILSGIMFSLAHISFRDKLFLQMTTVGGFLLSIFYVLVPSFLLISIIHAIVGIYAFYYGFVKFEGINRII